MNNNSLKIILLLVLTFSLVSLSPGQESSRDKIIQFAHFLFENRDFSRAAYEYLRVIHLYENSPSELDDLNFRIGNCFSLLNKPENAQKYYEYCLQSKTDEDIYKKALLNLGFLFFKIWKYDESNSVLDRNKLSANDQILNTIILANYLCIGKAKEAGAKFQEFRKAGRPYVPVFDKYLEMIGDIKYKSPLKAGLWSAVLPGSGRIYAGRLKEGLISMITFFATSYLAYEGFRDNGIKSFKGWLFSSISAFLYIGNIYGSVISARLTNTRIQDGYRKGIEISLSVLVHGR
jgi:tetratricopeptide (TPR) repeat protein